MLDWISRWWRVEVALFICYFDSLRRGDQTSYRYCAQKSMMVSLFGFVTVVGGLTVIGVLFGFSVWRPVEIVVLGNPTPFDR